MTDCSPQDFRQSGEVQLLCLLIRRTPRVVSGTATAAWRESSSAVSVWQSYKHGTSAAVSHHAMYSDLHAARHSARMCRPLQQQQQQQQLREAREGRRRDEEIVQ